MNHARSTMAHKPVAIITIGMAGAGKSTFVQRVNAENEKNKPPTKPPYVINLDPAVTWLPFEPNIDIRDTVDYKQVMKQYNLGPNGGILTALNLFTTKFDQVLDLVGRRVKEGGVGHILIDTPGQIEIFTWSASGAIITSAISYPTVIAYVVDTPRATASPATFMSNMLYACSILYKTQLPFILVFNKTDVEAADRAKEWMTDFEAFQEALASGSGKCNLHDSDGEPTYMNSLMTSMSLVLDEFYKTLRAVGVSSLTGDGMKEFFDAVDDAKEEYLRDYLPTLVTARLQREEQLKKARSAAKEDSLRRLMKDLEVDRAKNPSANDRWAQEEDDDEGADDELDVNIIDRSEDRWPGQYVDITRARRPGVEGGEEWEGGRWARPS
ncbi:XPA-binding protein 1 [Irpex lacteus]|nr:XPA-binding protein 1 [Irpex lacteus]